MPDFRVLGPFEVVAGVSGEGALRLGGPKQRAVLALLVLRANEVVATEAIVDALWGETVPGSATAVVRTYVSRLRQVLAAPEGTAGEVTLASRPRGYALEVDPDRVDAHRFRQLVARGRDALAAGDPDIASDRLRRALDLWRGDVLADLDGLGALRPEIAQLEELRLAAAGDRVEVELALGHHAEIVGELEALTRQHPFQERLWGQLMVALYRSGRQADALTAYRTVRATLVDQLGIEPGPALQTLERDILDQAPTLAWHSPDDQPDSTEPRSAGRASSSPLPLPAALANTGHGRRFVGRARERAVLARSLDAARAGRFTMAFVAGPPGIGKTGLVGWLAGEAHAEGASVVLGRADEGADMPFQPLGEAIRHWATQAPLEELELLPDADTCMVARLAPVLAERRAAPPMPPVPDVGSQADRQRLFEAIGRWIEALAELRPAVVVLEDLHWADPASVLALHHLVRHPPLAGALLVVTHRDTEIGGRPELAELLASIPGETNAPRIGLAGLHDRDVVDMLRTQAGRDVGPRGQAFAAELNHVAGGSPLFLHEMLHHLTERGIVDPDADRWPGQQEPLVSFGVPSAVTDVIEQRLGRLPARTATVLRSAAVLAEHVDLPVLSQLVEMPGIAVVEALEPALAAGLVTHVNPRTDRFAFSHSLVRDAIQAALPLSQRARTHWRAGEAIASLAASQQEPPLGEIARHYAAGVSAGDPHTAVVANIRAGQRALAALAFEDARARFTTAIELAESTGVSDPEVLYNAWFSLGEADSVLSGVHHLHNGFLRAIAIAREQRWPERLASATVGLAAADVFAYEGDVAGQAAGAAALVDEALDGLDEAPSVNRGLLLSIKAVGAIDQRSRARSLARRAAEDARSLDDPMALAGSLVAQCWALLGTPNHHDLGEAAERALALDASPEVGILVHSFVTPMLPVAALQRGDRTGFESVHRRLATDTRLLGSPHLAAYIRTWDAAGALGDGRFDEAERLIATIPLAADWDFWRLVSVYLGAVLARERGRLAEVRAGLAGSMPSVWEPMKSQMRAMLAALHAEAGEHAEAAHHAGILRRDLDLDQLTWSSSFILRHLTEVAAHLGDASLAAELLPLLSDHSGLLLVSFTGMTIDGAADRAIGQLLLTLGRLDEAVERFTAAHAHEESFGAPALAVRTTYWHTRARLSRNTPDDRRVAGELLDQAASDARRLGMHQLEHDIAALTNQRH